MPPNLGGFFMVRSYYPSECHADYFDFERIEALKPAIEACGISTLSQSPMLGFHKQMDNRIKLLEEILSFRMQGVEFANGDMYVDGHKAASDVRDEFVSVTEKLMDELAQCYNVLPQLDINNTIDHRPEGDEKWFLENEKTVTQFCRKLAAERPLKDIRDEYNYPKNKGIKDACSRLLEDSTMKSRRGFAIQRLMNAMRQAHADGWFIVFDTLTLDDDRLEAFYDNPNALRDYFRDIGQIATDRSRARRCVEACVYGTLDFVGYPRFPAPVEFIAAVIAYYVHPVNIQTACLIMEGAEFTENIINGVERPVKAAELFAFTLRVRAGNTDVLTDAEENVRQKLRAEGVM